MNLKKSAYIASTTAYMVLASGGRSFAQPTVDDGGGGASGEQRNISLENGVLFQFNSKPQDLVAFIVNAAFVVAVLLALLYLIWGGINWIMSGGDKEKVGAARSKIIAAIVGLILVILAYVILNFVLVLITGNGINSLTLPSLMGDPNPEVFEPTQ